jgi:hypothetical protein
MIRISQLQKVISSAQLALGTYLTPWTINSYRLYAWLLDASEPEISGSFLLGLIDRYSIGPKKG